MISRRLAGKLPYRELWFLVSWNFTMSRVTSGTLWIVVQINVVFFRWVSYQYRGYIIFKADICVRYFAVRADKRRKFMFLTWNGCVSSAWS